MMQLSLSWETYIVVMCQGKPNCSAYSVPRKFFVVVVVGARYFEKENPAPPPLFLSFTF